jgi:hypothetical protein
MTTLETLCRDAGQNYDFAREFLARECAKGIGCASYQAAVDRGEAALDELIERRATRPAHTEEG